MTLVFTLLNLFVPTNAMAAEKTVFTDVNGHWAEKSIKEMVQRGIDNGYPD